VHSQFNALVFEISRIYALGATSSIKCCSFRPLAWRENCLVFQNIVRRPCFLFDLILRRPRPRSVVHHLKALSFTIYLRPISCFSPSLSLKIFKALLVLIPSWILCCFCNRRLDGYAYRGCLFKDFGLYLLHWLLSSSLFKLNHNQIQITYIRSKAIYEVWSLSAGHKT
jgi:hypothetical protein